MDTNIHLQATEVDRLVEADITTCRAAYVAAFMLVVACMMALMVVRALNPRSYAPLWQEAPLSVLMVLAVSAVLNAVTAKARLRRAVGSLSERGTASARAEAAAGELEAVERKLARHPAADALLGCALYVGIVSAVYGHRGGWPTVVGLPIAAAVGIGGGVVLIARARAYFRDLASHVRGEQ